MNKGIRARCLRGIHATKGAGLGQQNVPAKKLHFAPGMGIMSRNTTSNTEIGSVTHAVVPVVVVVAAVLVVVVLPPVVAVASVHCDTPLPKP